MSDAPVDAAPAWFGKLSCLGDFARRRLDDATVRRLDDWLVAGLAHSRARLGERWLDAYLTSPIWRFAFAPGVLDACWWFGVLMPSVDSAGRYFPLVVAQRRAQAPADAAALGALEAWYARLAQAALATLDPEGTMARFEQALDALPVLASQDTPHPMPTARSEQACVLAQQLAALARDEMLNGLAGRSLWWACLPEDRGARVRTIPGLPEPDAFAQLFEGSW